MGCLGRRGHFDKRFIQAALLYQLHNHSLADRAYGAAASASFASCANSSTSDFSIGLISLAILAEIVLSPTRVPSTFSTASFCCAGSSTSTNPKPLDVRTGLRSLSLNRRRVVTTLADLTLMDRFVKISVRPESSMLKGRLATKIVVYCISWNGVRYRMVSLPLTTRR